MTDNQDCIFCKIIGGQIPSHKLAEGQHTVAILDAFPTTRGHALVLTKQHRQDILAMTPLELADAHLQLQRVASAVQQATGCPAFNIISNTGSLAGQIVFHAHFHIMPRYENDILKIKLPKYQCTDEEKNELAQSIRQRLE